MPLYTNIVTGISAIGGGIAATYFTHYFANKKQLYEEKRFNANIRRIS